MCGIHTTRANYVLIQLKGENKAMLAKQVSRDGEIYCTADTPLTEVFNKMTEIGCACMPVVESPNHKNIIGTITEHDICRRLIVDGLNPQRTSAGRVLNGNFTTVRGDAGLEDCAALFKLSGAGRLFVVDENGAFLGILTEKELAPEKTFVNLETVITDFGSAVAPALPTASQLAY
jgi:CBS domain-containing protein